MSYRDDDDNEFERPTRNRHSGGGRRTAPDDDMGMEKTDFSTVKLVGDDGRFFGMKVSASTASSLNMFSQTLIPWARRTLSGKGEIIARDFAKTHLGHNTVEAMRFGNTASDAIGYATIFAPQIAQVGTNLYESTRAMNDLRKAVTPVIKGTKKHASIEAVFGDGDNDLFRHARAKINGLFWQRMIKTATGAVAAVPQLMLWSDERKVANKERDRRQTIEKLNDGNISIDEAVKLFEEEMGHNGFNAGRLEEVRGKLLDKLVATKREEYLNAFKEFERKEGSKIARELKVEIGDKHSTDPFDTEKRKRYDVPALPEDLKDVSDPKNAERRKRYDKLFDDGIKNATKRLTRRKFIESRGGAFDDSWLEDVDFGKASYSRHGSRHQQADGRKTIRAQLEERVNKAFDQKSGIDAKEAVAAKGGEEDKFLNGKSIKEFAYSLGGGMAGDVVSNFIGSKGMEKYLKPQALDYVLNLCNALVTSDEGQTPDMVPGFGDGSETVPSMSFAQAVHTIFQKNQEDGMTYAKDSQKWGLIAGREFEHFEKARWDDEAIQQMDDSELTSYEYAVKHIAHRLKQGQMGVEALEVLVGDRNIKLVHKNGKSFGPKSIQGSVEKVKEAIGKTIEEQTVRFRPRHEMSEEQVAQTLGELPFTEEELKVAFGPSGLKGEERAFFFTLVDALVPDSKVLCAKTGMNEKTCETLRKESQVRFGALLDAAIMEMAEPEQLAAVTLGEEEKASITSLAEKAQAEGKDIAEIADKKDLRTAEVAVAGLVLAESKEPHKEGEEKQGFWQRMVARAGKAKEAKALAKEEAAHEDKHARHARHGGDDGESLDGYGEEKHSYASRVKKHSKEDDRDHLMDELAEGAGRDDGFDENTSKKKYSHLGKRDFHAHASRHDHRKNADLDVRGLG